MRVLFVVNGLGTGGSERSLAELLPGVQAAGIECVVACLHRRPQGVEASVTAQGFDVRFLAGSSALMRARSLRSLICELRPDLLHSTIFEADLATRVASFGTSMPVLTSLVNTSYDAVRLGDPNVGQIRLQLARAADGFTARHLGDHFHAVSEAVKAAALRSLRVRADRVTVIERGRDPARLGRRTPGRRARIRARLGLEERHEVLISVGRQEYQKGQTYLLGAMTLLAATRPHAVLLVAGREGNSTEELHRQHRQSGLGERVRFLGHHDDVPDLLAAADVLAFPSLYEGMPGAVIEAMALELPVVGSDIPPMREVVEPAGSGVLVPAASTEPLAHALSEVLADAHRSAALGRRGREIFEDRFTTDRATSRMTELYRHLVNPAFGLHVELSPRTRASPPEPVRERRSSGA